jgi:hypothetical protein
LMIGCSAWYEFQIWFSPHEWPTWDPYYLGYTTPVYFRYRARNYKVKESVGGRLHGFMGLVSIAYSRLASTLRKGIQGLQLDSKLGCLRASVGTLMHTSCLSRLAWSVESVGSKDLSGS